MPSLPARPRGLPPLPPWMPRGYTRGLLFVFLVCSLASALLARWLPGGSGVLEWLVCETDLVLRGHVWRPFTAGFVQAPSTWSLLFGLLAIYFFTPDLAARWGTKKLSVALISTFGVGYGMNVIVDGALALVLPEGSSLGALRPSRVVLGAAPAITMLVAGWAREHADRQLRFFFFPMLGKHMFWLQLAICTLNVFFGEGGASGNVALFASIALATAMSGSPSMARRVFLRLRLHGLGRERDEVSEALRKAGASTKRERRPGAPDLRVLPGGAEDKKDPKDKRYLN